MHADLYTEGWIMHSESDVWKTKRRGLLWFKVHCHVLDILDNSLIINSQIITVLKVELMNENQQQFMKKIEKNNNIQI